MLLMYSGFPSDLKVGNFKAKQSLLLEPNRISINCKMNF